MNEKLNIKISEFMDDYLDKIMELINQNKICKKIIDEKSFNSILLGGTSFQIGIIYETLANSSIKNKRDARLNQSLVSLQNILRENFLNNSFNYFNTKFLPDDLDTASLMTRIIDEQVIVKKYKEQLSLFTTEDKYYKTWFDANADSKHRWASGGEYYHIDVLLNCFLTLQKTELGSLFTTEHLRNLIQSKGLVNYWYIPSLYTAYFYSKILTTFNSLFCQLDFDVLESTLFANNPFENKFASLYNLTSCKYSNISELVLKDKQSWLNKALFIGSMCNLRIAQKRVDKDLIVLIKNEIEPLISQSWVYTPAFYWSLGFTPYRSRIINQAILSEILWSISQYLYSEVI